ncbi:hypothetical protein [Hoeflea sp.]|uniref:hypothetical protein n=1 Tax=Hoeflea sp. TaxID=1940281 RepID=UPI003747BAAA
MLMDLISWLGVDNKDYIPATITGVLGFSSVVFTGLAAIAAWIIKQNLLRSEKRNDIRSALRAEIEVQWHMLVAAQDPEIVIPQIEKKLDGPGGTRYTPHFTRHLDAEIYRSIKGEIAALGRREIPPIVKFYHHMAVLDSFVAELRSPDFVSFDRDRKLMMIRHMFEMIEQAVTFAEDALAVLESVMYVPTSQSLSALRFRAGRHPSQIKDKTQ